MDDEDRPTGANGGRKDAASLLATEDLDRYSLDELATRIQYLEAEVARVITHRDKSAAHRRAAEALFGRPAT
jgi:uncharacterized small protein (DUF1192 family)